MTVVERSMAIQRLGQGGWVWQYLFVTPEGERGLAARHRHTGVTREFWDLKDVERVLGGIEAPGTQPNTAAMTAHEGHLVAP